MVMPLTELKLKRRSNSVNVPSTSSNAHKRSKSALEFDKNRPLPPLPLEIRRRPVPMGEAIPEQVDCACEVSARTPQRKNSDSASPHAISTPGNSSQSQNVAAKPKPKPRVPYKLDTSPSLAGTEFITIKLDTPYSPFTPTVVLAAAGMKRATIRKSLSMSDARRRLDFSGFDFGLKSTRESKRSGHMEIPIPPHERGGGVNNQNPQPNDREEKEDYGEEVRVKLEVQLDDPVFTPLAIDEKPCEISLVAPEIVRRRSVPDLPKREDVKSQEGVEERQYLRPPQRPMPKRPPPPLPLTARTETSDMKATLHPPLQIRKVHQQPATYETHAKNPSTSSSRSRSTISIFCGSSGDRDADAESEVTDYEDYEEDINATYTCDSSFMSVCASSSCYSSDSDSEFEDDESVATKSRDDPDDYENIALPASGSEQDSDEEIGIAVGLGISGVSSLPSSDGDMEEEDEAKLVTVKNISSKSSEETVKEMNGAGKEKSRVGKRRKIQRVGSWDLLYPLGTKGTISRSPTPVEDDGRLRVIVEPKRPATAPERHSQECHSNDPTSPEAESPSVDSTTGLEKIKQFFSRYINRPPLTEVERGRRNSERGRKMGIHKIRRNLSQVRDGLSAGIRKRREEALEAMPVPPPPVIAVEEGPIEEAEVPEGEDRRYL
ncbi:hypothetical protein ABW19_dt0200379 [Dactylella cylindrospora]|nr:hypothetical protein ABW19_dt0200379 [Dactylella cylindrospora]